jgi:hypothetical protein
MVFVVWIRETKKAYHKKIEKSKRIVALQEISAGSTKECLPTKNRAPREE